MSTITLDWLLQSSILNTAVADGTGSIAADPNGDYIYLAYASTGTVSSGTNTGSNDVVLAKIDSSGNVVWIRQNASFNSTGTDQVPSIAVDSNSNVYMTYTTNGTVSGVAALGSTDIVVVKFDSNGNRQWNIAGNSLSTSSAEANPRIAVDSSGTVFLAYETNGTVSGATSVGSTDILLTAISPSGTILWKIQSDILNTANGEYTPGIAVDSAYIYLAYSTPGTVSGSSPDVTTNMGGNRDLVVTKLNKSNGSRVWIKQNSNFNLTTHEYTPRIAVDANGNVYVAYSRSVTGSSWNLAVLKFAADSTQSWLKDTTIFNTTYAEQNPNIALTSNGDPIITYITYGSVSGGLNTASPAGSQADIVLLKLNRNDGSVIWLSQHPSLNTALGEGSPTIAIDKNNKVYVAYATNSTVSGGTNVGGAGTSDVVLLRATDPTIVAVTLPDAPTSVTASSSTKSQATVSWSAPSSNGGTISSYTITVYDASGNTVTTATSTTTSKTITGLTNGRTYTFKVAATNEAGTGALSTASAPLSLPFLIFNAPTRTNRYVNALHYTVSSASGLPASVTVTDASRGTTPSFTWNSSTGALQITGLSEYTAYRFTIASTEYTSITSTEEYTLDATAPGIVSGLSVNLDVSQQITLSWTPIAQDSGSTIIGYKIYQDISTNTLLRTVSSRTSSSTTFTGLTNGTSYTYEIAAYDTDGNIGNRSFVTGTPRTVPGVVQSVGASIDLTTVTISWSAPSSNGGSAVTGYTVSRTGGPSYDVSANVLSQVFTGLTDGQSYTFTVIAKNIAGSSISATVSATPDVGASISTLISDLNANIITLATFKTSLASALSLMSSSSLSSLSNLNIAQFASSVLAGVTLPTNADMNVLMVKDGSTLNLGTFNKSAYIYLPNIPGQVTTYILSWASGSSNIAFDVSGNLFIDDQPFFLGDVFVLDDQAYLYVANGSAVGQAVYVPDAPTNVVATAGANQATVTWVVSGNGGAPIIGYEITSSPASSTTLVGVNDPLPITVTGLTAGVQYTFYVTAINDVGMSAAGVSNPVTILADGGGGAGGGGAPCFFGNARVLTPSGYRRMDSLAVGDEVMTPQGIAVTIARVKVTECPATAATNPYVIPKGTFGATHKLLISPDHKICIGDKKIKAKHLGLAQEMREGYLTYYNLELARAADMVVSGVAVESLAPVRRVVMSLADFSKAVTTKYGAASPAVLAHIKRTCRFVGKDAIEVPVLHH